MGDEVNSVGTAAAEPVQSATANASETAANSQQSVIESAKGSSERASSDQEKFTASLREEMKGFFGAQDAEVSGSQGFEEEKGSPLEEKQPDEKLDEDDQSRAKDDGDGTEESPVYRDEDGREVIPAIYIDELKREVTLEELIEKFNGFDYYHQNATKAADDARRINEAAAAIEQQRQELQQKLGEINAFKNDPSFRLAELIGKDAELKGQVMDFLKNTRPESFKALNRRTATEERKQMLVQIQADLNLLKKSEIQRAEEARRQQFNYQIDQTSRLVEQYVKDRVKGLADQGITVTDNDLQSIADSYIPMLKQGGYSFEPIKAHFENYFKLVENKAQQLINGYRQSKKAAQPAPPSGGAAPAITPVPIRNDDDFFAKMESSLAYHLGNMT